MEEELSEYEIEHLRKLSVLQRTATAILMKWRRLLVSVFLVTGAVFVLYLALHTARSVHRFDADTRLIFTPRTAPGIEAVTDRQLMSVIDRKSLKRKVGERVDMPQKERECLTLDMEIKQGNKQTNLFSLKARSSSWVGAVRKVNAYAEVLIDEYEQYRLQDLENWRESFMIRRTEQTGIWLTPRRVREACSAPSKSIRSQVKVTLLPMFRTASPSTVKLSP